ncbi:hypothetical protein PF005_g16223 [Phytophthora fragariae]|uniref:Uncharacterized protein n=1 Tax=Phytophthora fragariae TaxID=53985 RepID=A0A6A3JHR8_9STRA|nr:hypothetical protein PF003_g10725 [Phytophthora fragariae]KAE8932468.1 hypothetical protein PF009_g17508 [Phytophthora fragariae]KAE8994659.1 hypothetical protein PF011_g16646 [Phytophthora fragariae]KAE9098335.1 hypothetical protein PF007_g16305 [Phytophthora fragariae]KAE9098485.1 hypothetical protein PF010_g15543 [Phytophthora fragariae]
MPLQSPTFATAASLQGGQAAPKLSGSFSLKRACLPRQWRESPPAALSPAPRRRS